MNHGRMDEGKHMESVMPMMQAAAATVAVNKLTSQRNRRLNEKELADENS